MKISHPDLDPEILECFYLRDQDLYVRYVSCSDSGLTDYVERKNGSWYVSKIEYYGRYVLEPSIQSNNPSVVTDSSYGKIELFYGYLQNLDGEICALELNTAWRDWNIYPESETQAIKFATPENCQNESQLYLCLNHSCDNYLRQFQFRLFAGL